VFLDLIMPELGGKRCLEELLKFDPQVRVLVASGHLADSSARELIEAGAKGYVNKPYEMHQLLKAVRQVLDATIA